jgi:two-component system, chemotaxis family, chemotaxis protein CheY
MLPLSKSLKGPVLLVEDDHDVRVTLRAVLEDEGYEVLSATNGKHALEVLAQTTHKPRLALVDLMMPVMDGWEFVALLKQTGSLAAMPVVVHTAFRDREPPSGVGAVLKKPIDVDALLDIVRQYVG